MTTKTEIKAAAIYKILNQNCYAVPSDSSNDMYKVCFDESASNWTCTCKHGEFQASRGQAARCKHVAAVQISIKANLRPVVKPVEISVKGTLNRKAEFKMEAAPSGRLVPMR